MSDTRQHRLHRMTGRDPHDSHRAATPLELLFDLSFVVAYGAAGNELAHAFAEDHITSGLLAFGFVMFAITWAWINYSWFASAYDTDDWAFRLLTMLQMAGVIVVALGIPEVFESIDEGRTVDNAVMVGGYIVMRVAMVLHWARVTRQDPQRRETAQRYVATILAAQVGWVVLLVAETTVAETFFWGGLLILVELTGPVLAERRGDGSPWHAHHISERYGLLVIITLGEGVIGTIAVLSALVHTDVGWSTDAILLLVAGVAVTFGMWWIYFTIPAGEVLHRFRDRSFFWGYFHIIVFAAIVAVGAGLHAAGYLLEDHSELGVVGTVLTVALPVGAFVVAVLVLYAGLVRAFDTFHLMLLGISLLVLGAGVALAAGGTSMSVSLLVVALTPWVTVIGYELVGHRHLEQHLENALAQDDPAQVD